MVTKKKAAAKKKATPKIEAVAPKPVEPKVVKAEPVVDKKKESNEAYAIRKLGKAMKVLLKVLCKTIGPKIVKEIEEESGIDIDKDGNVGSANVGLIVIIAILCFSISAMGADSDNIVNWSARSGTAKITQVDRTGDMKLEIDKVATTGASSFNTGGTGSGTSVLSTVTGTFSESGTKTITYTLASAPLILLQEGDATTNVTGSIHLGVLPEGFWNFDGTVVDDITIVATNIGFDATNEWAFAIGSAAATGTTLSGTEINFASTNGISQATNDYDTVSATTTQLILDGTDGGVSIYLNCLAEAAAGSAFTVGTTNLLNGTVTVTGNNCGDN